MLFFIITFFSFFLFYKSLPLQPLPPWAHEMRLVSFWLFYTQCPSFIHLTNCLKSRFESIPTKMKEIFMGSRNDNIEESDNNLSLLDLPELTLECILERLPPDGLCKMASVCSSLRSRCMSNHLWEKHMKKKWGRIIGTAAYREWKWQLATRSDLGFLERGKGRWGFLDFLCRLWPCPLLFIRSKVEGNIIKKKNSSTSPPVDSIKAWYLALETGKFWFPAQVYNREVRAFDFRKLFFNFLFFLNYFCKIKCYESRKQFSETKNWS